jgi:Cytochrome c554 and c-prime
MAGMLSRGRFSVVIVTLLLALGWSIRTHSQPGRAASPTFVGAQACATCHAQVHADWKGARHSKMIQPATAASVVGDFSKDSVTLKGQRYRLRVANGEYFISESYLTGKEQEHKVELTLGSRRIQHYLTTIEHGSIIVLPPSWDVQRGEWFDNMDIVRPDENDQKPVQQWNKNCVGCHVSQQENNYRAAERTYKTEWTDFGTSCERCHGPGSAHVQAYARGMSDRAAGQADAPRPHDEQHDLRAVSLLARHRRSWIHSWRGLLRLLPAGARVRTAQGTGSDLLARRPPAPFLERCVGPLAE